MDRSSSSSGNRRRGRSPSVQARGQRPAAAPSVAPRRCQRSRSPLRRQPVGHGSSASNPNLIPLPSGSVWRSFQEKVDRQTVLDQQAAEAEPPRAILVPGRGLAAVQPAWKSRPQSSSRVQSVSPQARAQSEPRSGTISPTPTRTKGPCAMHAHASHMRAR